MGERVQKLEVVPLQELEITALEPENKRKKTVHKYEKNILDRLSLQTISCMFGTLFLMLLVLSIAVAVVAIAQYRFSR